LDLRFDSPLECVTMKKPTDKPVVLLAAVAWVCWDLAPVAFAQEPARNSAVVTASPAATQDDKPGLGTAPAPALTNRPEDEKAIRAVGDAFARSFTAGDAKSVAAMFSEDGELIDENGERAQGRRAIEELYTGLFQSRPRSTIDIAIESLRFLSPDVAKEEGHTQVKSAGEPATLRRYTVLYVKQDGRWLYSSVREEHAATATHHEHLKPLKWLLGNWVDQSSDSTVYVSCRWSPDKNFLLRDFTVHVQGQPVMTVNQRIGWDGLTKQIKSWVFDSEGGYGDAFWVRKGNQWVVKSTGVLPDGRTASATHVLTPTGPNSARWSSTERTLGEQSIAEPAEYLMVRRAPAPQASRKP
jgi:uncharacterized protein (TIGR02246 family)